MTLTQIKPAGLSKPVDFADNEQIRLGTGNDLLIYHNGTSSEIESATGSLRLHGAQNQAIIFRNHDDTANVAVFNVDDATHLYFDSAHKFSTNSTGIRVVGNCIPGSNDSGQLGTSSIRWQELNITDVIDVSDNGKIRIGDSDDIEIYHNGSNSFITNSTGGLYIRSDLLGLEDKTNGHSYLGAQADGAVTLRYDNSVKFATTSAGVEVSGNLKIDDATKGIEVGDVTNDNYTNITHEIATNSGDPIRGFVAQNNNGGVFENLQGGTNQFLVLGDTDKDQSDKCLLGVSTNVGSTYYKRLELSGTGILTIANGIKFNNDTAADNKLDDYEEGTWSPSGSWTTITASYTKIGRMVYAGFSLRANASSGNVTIGNLPFTSGSTHGHVGGIAWGLCEFNTTDSWLNGSVDDDSTTATVRRGNATIVTFGSGNNNMNQNAFIRGMIIYMTA